MRTLDIHYISYAVIAESIRDSIFDTIYRNKVYAIRSSVFLELEDIFRCINEIKLKVASEKYIIAPTTEALNRFLLKNEELFELHGYIITLIEKKMYELISDKKSFLAECQKHGIDVPNEVDLSKPYKYPIVVKPKKYFSSDGNVYSPMIIQSYIDLLRLLKSIEISDFLVQEFVYGRSFYLLYYFYKDGRVKKFSQENLIQQSNGKSIIASVSSCFHESFDSLKIENIFKSINFSGLTMVEVRKGLDKTYIIEANPRFWGPSQLFVDSGFNLFECLLEELRLIEPQNIEYKTNKKSVPYLYFWYGGFLETLQKGEELIFHNYDENSFYSNFHEWIKADVYRRDDTLGVFINELKKLKN